MQCVQAKQEPVKCVRYGVAYDISRPSGIIECVRPAVACSVSRLTRNQKSVLDLRRHAMYPGPAGTMNVLDLGWRAMYPGPAATIESVRPGIARNVSRPSSNH